MNASTRKILRKIGAGLMLGLSLFNVGAAWNKADGWNIAKRSRRLKTKEKEQIETEMAAFAEIAEEEAEKAIKEQDLSQQQFQDQAKLTFAQQIYRASAVGLLGVGIGVFGSSMIFNTPFSLGKGLLSFLPGNPHLAVISLEPEKKNYSRDEKIGLVLKMDSAGDEISDIRVAVEYNPKLVMFEESSSSLFELKTKLDQKNENVEQLVVYADNLPARAFEKEESFARLVFSPRDMAGGKRLSFYVSREDSLAVAKKANLGYNVLGAAEGTGVYVEDVDEDKIHCSRLEKFEGTTSFWKDYIEGDLTNSREEYWADIDDQSGILCSYGEGYVFLSVVLDENQNINELAIKGDGFDKSASNADYSWEREGYGFYVFQLPLEREKTITNATVNIRSEFFNNKRWPQRGSGEIMFE